MPTFKQLKYFEAVARFNHFGKAAEHCAVSQPALSMQIKELERELDILLFERNNKRAIITKHGLELLARSRKITEQMRELTEFAQSAKDTLQGTLQLGVIPTIAPYLLPKLLPNIRNTLPDLNLVLHETQTHMLLEKLEDGDLDLLILALPIDGNSIATMPLMEDKFLLAMPPEHESRNDAYATPDMFANGELMLLEEGHCLREQALTYCHLREVSSFATFGASSLSTLVQMVGNGLGMTLLPEISLSVENKSNEVKLMRFGDPEPRRTIGLAWRAGSPRAKEFRKFGKLVSEALI